LNEVKESIMALRERKASYETIRAMLHENAGIDVSHQTVARIAARCWIQPSRRNRAVQDADDRTAAAAQEELPARPPISQPRSRDAHHAIKNL